jgi:uncharacterized protein YoxC
MDFPIDIRILIYVLVLAIVILAIYIVALMKKISSMLDSTTKSIDELSVNVNQTLRSIDTDFSELKSKLVNSLDDVDELTVNLTAATRELRSGINRVFNVVEPVEHLVDDVVGKVQPPLNQLATFVSASSKAVNTFLNILGKRKS